MPSRLPTQSSTLYSNNITKFLLSIAPKEKQFGIDLSDEVVRGAIVTQNGDIIPPAPRKAPPPAPAPPPTPTAAAEAEVVALTPFQKTSREVATVTAGMGTALALGTVTGPLFMTFSLASLIGYRVVWGVMPSLHSPLMSVTNAISGKCFYHGNGREDGDHFDDDGISDVPCGPRGWRRVCAPRPRAHRPIRHLSAGAARASVKSQESLDRTNKCQEWLELAAYSF